MSIKTIFVVGPTASGKTDLGARLAKRFSGEVVSADSMQIYKGVHIAAAVPDEDEKQGVPHHLIEFLTPKESFSVAQFTELAGESVKEIAARGHTPVVVGGTGLYIDALANGTVFSNENGNPALRKRLEERFEASGGEKMLEELKALDPETAAKLHPNDRKRIVRAFEIFETTGKTAAEQRRLSAEGEKFIEPCFIGVTCRDRQKLYDRINLRVDKMLEKGLVDEAVRASTESYGGARDAIGHKELYGFLRGECSLSEAAENLKMQTRRYAKRQLTWFRRNPDINWIYTDETADVYAKAESIAEKFLEGKECP